jgi:hypothetical protein
MEGPGGTPPISSVVIDDDLASGQWKPFRALKRPRASVDTEAPGVV